MKKLLLLAITAVFALNSFAQSDEVVKEQPKGTLETYTRAGQKIIFNQKTGEPKEYSQEGQALSVVTEADGKTVWLQDPVALTGAGSWVKGEKKNNTITVPGGQVVFVFDTDNGPVPVFAGMVKKEDSKYVKGDDNITYTISGDNIFLEGTNQDMSSLLGLYVEQQGKFMFLGYAEYGSTYTKFTEKPAVIPADVTLLEYTLKAANKEQDHNTFEDKMFIGKKGSDIYFKGLLAGFKDGVLKGTFDEKTNIATFDAKQFMGIYDSYLIYLLGTEDGNNPADKIMFQYNPEAKQYEALTHFIVFNIVPDRFRFYTYYSECTLKLSDPAGIEAVSAESAKQVASETYYDLSGCQISKPMNGVAIKTVKFTDGTTKSVKFIGK